MIVPSDVYKTYEHSAAWFMPHDPTIREPVNVRALFYMPTKRRVDLVNLEEALLDVLVHYGVIDDDNSTIVAGMDGSRVLYDKENPRTEVIIEYLGE
jgi:Holliday junction resolvase RusA-like endonuclease